MRIIKNLGTENMARFLKLDDSNTKHNSILPCIYFKNFVHLKTKYLLMTHKTTLFFNTSTAIVGYMFLTCLLKDRRLPLEVESHPPYTKTTDAHSGKNNTYIIQINYQHATKN